MKETKLKEAILQHIEFVKHDMEFLDKALVKSRTQLDVYQDDQKLVDLKVSAELENLNQFQTKKLLLQGELNNLETVLKLF